MLQPENKVVFRNLQPLTYLKTFNRMVDYNQRHPLQANPHKQLRTVSLTKFPLPQYYQHMQGIFESASRKKVDQVKSKLSQRQIQEQKFMKNHNEFMRKVLTKFIQHNEERQNLFEQDKKFVRRNQDPKNHLRTLSQPKIEKKKQKENDVNPQHISEYNHATKGSIQITDSDNKDQINSVFPKVKPPKKKEKFKIRKENMIEQVMINRKLTASIPPSRSTVRRVQNDEKLDFKDDIIHLQNKQTSKQDYFSQKVQRQIAQFDKKMDVQVHSIKYYNFWKEPVSYDSVNDIKTKNKDEDKKDGHAQFAINFRNYEST